MQSLFRAGLAKFREEHLPCRGCLRPLDEGAEAGLCARCWSGLVPLDALRCQRCALPHADGAACPDPAAWHLGDALWDYHGGRPALGAMLLPGIKAGELGWRTALLRRVSRAPLPDFTAPVDCVTAVPAVLHRRWLRGFDLAEDAAGLLAGRLGRPFSRLLRRGLVTGRQMGRTESERRRLPRKAVAVRPGADVDGKTILLVDDVWTTGTTLLRCAQALRAAGASEVRVLALFRST